MVRLRAALLAWTLIVTGAAAQQQWKIFHSSSGFSVKYPGEWYRLDHRPDVLNIISGKERAEGAIIAGDESMIVVIEKTGTPIPALMKEFASGVQVISSRAISRKPHSHECSELQEVVYRDEVGPHFYDSETTYFCSAWSRVFVIAEHHHESAARGTLYRGLARTMAESLTVVPNPQ